MQQSKQILLFFKKPLMKVAAAMTIQTAYRHYLWRRSNGNSTRFQKEIIRNRASLCMQAWWRSLRLTRRIKFLATLKTYLNKVDSNVIYMEETLYLELPNLIQEIAQKSTRFVEQYVAFGFEANTKQIVIRKLKVQRFENNLVPIWVLDDGSPFALAPRDKSQDGLIAVSSLESFTKSGLNLTEQMFLNDLMGIFHFTDAHPTSDKHETASTDTQVKDFNQIVNYRFKSIDLQKGLKFVEVRCGSV